MECTATIRSSPRLFVCYGTAALRRPLSLLDMSSSSLTQSALGVAAGAMWWAVIGIAAGAMWWDVIGIAAGDMWWAVKCFSGQPPFCEGHVVHDYCLQGSVPVHYLFFVAD